MGRPKSQSFAAMKLPMIIEESSVLDEDNPYSLINLVPGEIRAAMDAIPVHYYGISEFELRRTAKPTAEVARLRVNFWDEYLRAVDQKRKMEMVSVLKGGVCHPNYFYNVVLKEPKWVAYITIPPADYQLALREMLDLGLDRLREVLILPIVEKVPITVKEKNADTGKIEYRTEFIQQTNTKLISEIVKITNMLDLRVKGAILQKVQVENRNLNIHANADDPNVFLADATMNQLEAMEKKIERMKKEMELLDAPKDEEDAAVTIEASSSESAGEAGSFFAEDSAHLATEEDTSAEAGNSSGATASLRT